MTEIHAGYVNHIGSTTDFDGNIFAVITQDGPSEKDVDVVIKKLSASANPEIAQSWIEVKRFTEKEFGKHGFGSAEVRNNGDLVVMLSEKNDEGKVPVVVRVIKGVAASKSKPAVPDSGTSSMKAMAGELIALYTKYK
jgi:hypothetical protein